MRRDRARAGGPGGALLLAAALVLLLLGTAAPAAAHAALRATDPADSRVLQRAPRHLTLTFTESVSLLDGSFRVYGPDGRVVPTGGPDHADGRPDTARVALGGGGRPGRGTYAVAWRVVSADGHPVSGAFTFSVGAPSTAPAPPPAVTEDPLTAGLHAAARHLAYLAAALLIGTAAFAALCRPPDPAPLRAPLLTGWWTLLVTTTALLLLRAPYESGTGPAGALDPGGIGRTLTGRPGLALLARLALLALCGALYAGPGRRRYGGGRTSTPPAPAARTASGRLAPSDPARTASACPVSGRALALGAFLAVALALTWAGAEHASAGIQVPVATASAVLHLLAMAVWLGGLAALLSVLYRSTPPPPVTVTRFSRLALTSVTVLAGTGVYQSWRGLGSWQAVTGTPYGRLLLGKLALVALLSAAAARAHRRTRRQAARSTGTRAAAVGLRRAVLAEAALGVLVLVLTAALTGTRPGRAATEAEREGAAVGAAWSTAGSPPTATLPFDVGTPRGQGTVQITLDPGRVGENRVEAVVLARDGGPATVPEVRLAFTLASRGVGPLDARLTDRGGYWAADAVTLPLPGLWTMRATVRVSEVDQVTVSRRVRVTGPATG